MLVRSDRNPILTRDDIRSARPELRDVSAVFNPAAVKVDGHIHLLLRVQNRGRETLLVQARSQDGTRFTVDTEPIVLQGIERESSTIYHVYDPRLTRVGDEILLCFIMEIATGCRLGMARTVDMRTFEYLGIGAAHDTRHGVVFPEKFDDAYLRLERPNTEHIPGGWVIGRDIVLSESNNLVDWAPRGAVIRGRPHYWDERVGSGPPPLKTRQGWLHLYHGVARHQGSVNVYQAGVVLLDLSDPSQVIARGRYNVLEPRTDYELMGQVPAVVFPTGWIVDTDEEGFASDEAELLVYYGAANTCVGLATCTVGELLAACHA